LACLSVTGARTVVGGVAGGGWTTEPGTAEPSYAVVEPRQTNLNIDTVVLACEEAWGSRVLQIELYLTDEGPLRPIYPHTRPLKDDPRAEISIDGQIFPVALLFADDYVVLADAQEGVFPSLSTSLVDAMQRGKTMTLRFDLLSEWSGQPTFDGEAIVDLRAPGGPEAITALRHCGEPSIQRRMANGHTRQ
jgi:hypothetical protein